jgi:hypothetical protein
MRSGQRKILRPTVDYLGYAVFRNSGLQQAHRESVEIALRDELSVRDTRGRKPEKQAPRLPRVEGNLSRISAAAVVDEYITVPT